MAWLGGEGMTQLVRRDAPESGLASDLFNSGVHSRCGDPAPMVGEQEDREVAGKEQDASRSVIACPFRETSERHAEGSQVTGYRSAAQQRRTSTSWSNR